MPAGFEGPTTRQRDLVFRLPFNLAVDSFCETDPVTKDRVYDKTNRGGEAQISIRGFRAGAGYQWINMNPASGVRPPGWVDDFQPFVQFSASFFPDDPGYPSQIVVIPPTTVAPGEYDPNGMLTIRYPVEQFVSFGTNFSTNRSLLRLWENRRPGTLAELTVTFGGVSGSVLVPFNAAMYGFNGATTFARAIRSTASASMTPSQDGLAFGYPFSREGSVYGYVGESDAIEKIGFNRSSTAGPLIATTTAYGLAQTTTGFRFSEELPRRVIGIEGEYRCFDQRYPGTVKVFATGFEGSAAEGKAKAFAGNGGVSGSGLQRACSSNLVGFPNGDVTSGNLYAYPDSATYNAQGDQGAGAPFGRALYWPCVQLAHQDHVSAVPAQWDDGGILYDGPDLELSSTGADRTILAEYPSGLVTMGYRYFMANVVASVGQVDSVTLTVGADSWAAVPDENGDVIWDTARSASDRDGTWPLHLVTFPDGTGRYLPTAQRTDALNYAESLTLAFHVTPDSVAGEAVFTISGFRLQRKRVPALEFVTSFGPEEAYKGVQTARRGMCAIVDGRMSLEFPAQINGAGVGVEQFVAYVNGIPGWSATLLDSGYPYILNTSVVVGELGGPCAAWNGERWVDFSNREMTGGSIVIPAQVTYEEFDPHPGAGEPQTGVGYGDASIASPYRFLGVLRGRAWGIAEDASSTATAIDDEGNTGGTATVLSDMSYQTGAPWLKHGKAYALKSGGETLGDVTGTSGRRRRASLAARPIAGSPWEAQTADGRFVRSYIQSGNARVQLAGSSSPVGGWVSDVQATTYGDVDAFRFALDKTTQRLWAVVGRVPAPGTREVWQCYSDDDGKTFGGFAKVADGRNPQIGEGDGDLLMVWFRHDSGDSGPGKLYAKYRGRGDAALSAEYSLKDSTGAPISVRDESSFGNPVRMSDGQTRWQISLTKTGEAAPTVWFSTESKAETFTKVV